MITRADLKWWLELAPTLDWTFATTYAEGAPHEYVIHGKTEGMTRADYVRAARVIRTFGEPAKFYKTTNIYLTSPCGQHRWWGMSRDIEKSGIVNRCRPWHVYGVQNAPRTASGIESEYDAVATEWDADFSATDDERTAYVEILREIADSKYKRVLDIGCGTGLSLDLGLSQAVRFTGVDPSQAMLNELTLKHPHTAALHPMRFDTALERKAFDGTRFDAVIALGGSGTYLSPQEIAALPQLTKGPILLTHIAPEHPTAFTTSSTEQQQVSLRAASELSTTHNGKQFRLGRFVCTQLDIRDTASPTDS